MKVDNAQTAQTNALSDKELTAVSGGKARVQVTKEQYEQCLEVMMMFATLKKSARIPACSSGCPMRHPGQSDGLAVASSAIFGLSKMADDAEFIIGRAFARPVG